MHLALIALKSSHKLLPQIHLIHYWLKFIKCCMVILYRFAWNSSNTLLPNFILIVIAFLYHISWNPSNTLLPEIHLIPYLLILSYTILPDIHLIPYLLILSYTILPDIILHHIDWYYLIPYCLILCHIAWYSCYTMIARFSSYTILSDIQQLPYCRKFILTPLSWKPYLSAACIFDE